MLLSCRIDAIAMLKVRPPALFGRAASNKLNNSKNVALGKRAECTLCRHFC